VKSLSKVQVVFKWDLNQGHQTIAPDFHHYIAKFQ
jgi:hypothetical protein